MTAYDTVKLYARIHEVDVVVAEVLVPPLKVSPEALLWHDDAYVRDASGRYVRLDTICVFTAEQYRTLALHGEIT